MPKLATRDEADRAIARYLPAVSLTAEKVTARYRSVPRKGWRPWMAVRLTTTQRSTALASMVNEYDRLISAWDEFVFLDATKSRDEMIFSLGAALQIGEELRDCEQMRAACASLGKLTEIKWGQARERLGAWNVAIDSFEEAAYRAAVRASA